jgi:hypothetical protein
MFLERDSQSDRYGIHTFPSVTYIQVAVRSTKRIEQCRAWITRVDYNPDGTVFSLEHNERLPRHWAKHAEGDDLEVELDPEHPAIRFNIAIYSGGGNSIGWGNTY